MRLHRLDIRNVRGIPNLTLEPKGQSLVIFGANGSGKSAVVDAIDFLLTGKISRLTGQGTGGITLQEYGPHVGHTPDEAVVVGTVQFAGDPCFYELSRCMSHPNELKSNPKLPKSAASVLEIA
jgi:energy-coupling factor transporter ATP-binding protein EcfA2